MKTAASVPDLIALYVAGSISAADLANSLPDGADLDETDETTATVALRTMGYLAEYENGDRSEFDLVEVLAPEASWRLEQQRGAISPFIQPAPVTFHVSVGADRPLLAGYAS